MNTIDGFNFESFINIAIDPHRTDEVIKIQSSLLKASNRPAMIQWLEKACLADEEFMELYKKKYFPSFPTIEELKSCPEGSLGRALSVHLIKNNIALDFTGIDTSVFYQKEVTPLNYMAARGIRTHDVYHIIANLGVTPLEENVLLHLQLAQFCSPYHYVLMAAGNLHFAFYKPEQMPDLLEQSNKYYQIGKKAKFLPGFPYEDHWRTSLREVRSMLRIDEDELSQLSSSSGSAR